VPGAVSGCRGRKSSESGPGRLRTRSGSSCVPDSTVRQRGSAANISAEGHRGHLRYELRTSDPAAGNGQQGFGQVCQRGRQDSPDQVRTVLAGVVTGVVTGRQRAHGEERRNWSHVVVQLRTSLIRTRRLGCLEQTALGMAVHLCHKVWRKSCRAPTLRPHRGRRKRATEPGAEHGSAPWDSCGQRSPTGFVCHLGGPLRAQQAGHASRPSAGDKTQCLQTLHITSAAPSHLRRECESLHLFVSGACQDGEHGQGAPWPATIRCRHTSRER